VSLPAKIEAVLDWKESSLYVEYVVKRNNPKLPFEKPENNILREDELDFIKMIVGKKSKTLNPNEIAAFCEPMIHRSLNTLHYLLRDILTEKYSKAEYLKCHQILENNSGT
jgi:hypothetical protein